MYSLINAENIWNHSSNKSIFSAILVTFCGLIAIRKWLKRQSVVNPEGKAVLITGCDTGFGRLLALRLNSLGYRVYATVLNINSGESLLNESQNRELMVVHKMDVTLDEEVNDVFSKIKPDLEANNYLLWSVVNNAGFGMLAQLEWTHLKDYKRIFDVNVFGTVRVTNKFLPLIRASKGRLVMMSSVLALDMSVNSVGAYSMTKSAVKVFARTLRRELNKFSVKVVVLYPGGYKNTNFSETSFTSANRIWDQMDDSLKKSYGNEKYLEFWINRHKFSSDYVFAENSDHVINDLIDAVTNSVPKHEYKPMGSFIRQMMANILFVVPSSILDFLDSF